MFYALHLFCSMGNNHNYTAMMKRLHDFFYTYTQVCIILYKLQEL